LAAMALAIMMALLDVGTGPSLSLVASNSAILLVLTVCLVSLYGIAGREPAARESRDITTAEGRTLSSKMVGTLRGARDGYASSRLEVARILRGAANAKLGNSNGVESEKSSESYLRRILDPRSYSEFIAEPEEMAARVETDKLYIERLRSVVESVGRSIGL